MSFVQMFCLYFMGVYLLTFHVLLHYLGGGGGGSKALTMTMTA